MFKDLNPDQHKNSDGDGAIQAIISNAGYFLKLVGQIDSFNLAGMHLNG